MQIRTVTLKPFLLPFLASHSSKIRGCDSQLTSPPPPLTTHKPTTIQITKNQTLQQITP